MLESLTMLKAISRESDVRKAGLQVFTQFLAPCVIVIYALNNNI